MKALAIAFAIILVVAVGYAVAYPMSSYRFRITLNVDTPQGLKTGSSVMEVRHRQYPAWTTLGNNTGHSSLSGEAVFVDLGRDRNGRLKNLIALLALGPNGEGGDFYLLPGKAFEPIWKPKLVFGHFGGTAAEVAKLPIGSKAELHGNLIPTLLTFEDLSNPATARVVDPDDLQRTLGKDVRLQSATIEIVSPGTFLGFGGEPITRGIARPLPWWERPLPWLKSTDGRVFIDARSKGLKWNKTHFERG